MCADNCFGDVKSESPALAVGRTCLVRLVEAVEQQRKLLRRYGLTGIADAKARLLPVLLEHQSEAAAHGAELDGVIQQVDTPLDLYMKPKNLFVAGFIGSPQMNFIDARVTKNGNNVDLVFGEYSVRLPEAKAKKVIDGGYEDKIVVLGIRPEDIKDEEMFISQAEGCCLDATVKVYEMLGAEVFLYFTVDKYDITVRVNPRTTARPGDTVTIAFDMSKAHIFDKETEQTVTN